MPRWTGTIAYLDTPAVDGRTLQAPEELQTGPLPLPLIALTGEAEPVGIVDSVSVYGNEVRAEGTVRDGVLKPGEELPVGVDLDDVTPGEGPVFTAWRLRAVTVYAGQGGPAWPGVHIRLAD